MDRFQTFPWSSTSQKSAKQTRTIAETVRRHSQDGKQVGQLVTRTVGQNRENNQNNQALYMMLYTNHCLLYIEVNNMNTGN